VETVEFNQYYGEFRDLGVEVIGISADSADVLSRFAEKLGTSFPLVSDEAREIIAGYGVMKPTESRRADRCTFVLDRHGDVALAYGKVKAKDHAARVLADVRVAVETGDL
jgi:peroxiredoxin Q/BCP